MKRPTMTSRDARALALGALLIVPAVAYRAGIAPAWRAVQATRADAARERDALRRDQELLRRAADVRARQASTTTWLAREARRLFSRDELEATSELTEYVGAAAADAGARLLQTETRPSVAADAGLRAVRLDVRAVGESRAVLRFLRRLETGDRLVRVGRLTLVRRTGGESMRAKTSAAGEAMTVSADVYGYALVPPPPGVRVLSSERGAAYASLSGRPGVAADLDDGSARDPFGTTRGTVASAASPPPLPMQLVGTVVGDRGGNFAVCQSGSEAPVVVHRGEHIAGYLLREVERGSAVFSAPDGRIVRLSIPIPGA